MTVLSASVGQTLLWCAIQLTVVTTLAGLLARVVGRRNPAAGVWCLRAGLVAVVGVTALAAAPLPSWFGLRSADAEGTDSVATDTDVAAPASSSPAERGTSDPASESIAATQFGSLLESIDEVLTRAASMPIPAAEPVETSEASATGSYVLAVLWTVVGLAMIGGLWFAIGLVAVRRLLAGGESVTDPRVTETLDVVLAQLSCRRQVRLIETERVASPATVGFWRPVILLPSSWYNWTDEELHVVLAHEAAHVRANDFAATVLSQLVVAIHFFHPFAHFLSRQLRLTQELAADATASAVAKGRTEYASVLAGMALQTNSQRNLWATQAFLPAPRTMLRRIEMLRDSKELRTHVGRTGRAAIATVIAMATCAVVGLRANPATVTAQEPSAAAGSALTSAVSVAQRNAQPLSLDWVPNGSLAVVAIKPNELLKQPALQPLKEAVSSWMAGGGLKLEELDSVTLCWTHPEISQKRDRFKSAMALGTFAVVRTRSQTGFRFAVTNSRKTSVNGTTVYRKDADEMSAFMPDEFTLVTGQSEVIHEVLRTGRNGTTNRFWLKQWSLVKGQSFAALVDLGAIRESHALGRTYRTSGPGMTGPSSAAGGGYPGAGGAAGGGYPGGGGGEGSGVSGSRTYGDQSSFSLLSGPSFRELQKKAAPIFAHAELLVAAVSDGEKGPRINTIITTIDFDDGKKVLEAFKLSGLEAQRLLRRQQHSIARSRQPKVALLADLMSIAESVLETVVPQRMDAGVGATFEIPTDQLSQTMKRLAPAIEMASEEAKANGTQSVNSGNLKKIMLAMHNYHDAHGQFPPSITLGKNGVPVSWRVLITPFIERQDIFEKYRFDEPWNSEHNAKVTADMPEVFRHPLSDNSTSTGYFGVASSDADQPTCFGPGKIRLRDIRDGTSNTIAVVEAKRDVHWAKPEDLKFTPGGKLPKFGGFTPGEFAAAKADGSVGTYRQTDLGAIRNMLTIHDGKIIEDPAMNRR